MFGKLVSFCRVIKKIQVWKKNGAEFWLSSQNILNFPLPRFTGGGLPFIASKTDRLFLTKFNG